jgi:hypothetical protein
MTDDGPLRNSTCARLAVSGTDPDSVVEDSHLVALESAHGKDRGRAAEIGCEHADRADRSFGGGAVTLFDHLLLGDDVHGRRHLMHGEAEPAGTGGD